ncbi:MAG: 30S ribosomal protein S8 [bacterium]|nr:30S ribosomal protein S8 [bacterium]
MVNYPIGDMLIRITNAQAVGKEQVSVPFSKIKFKIAQILKENEFIQEVEKKSKKNPKSEVDYLLISLKYDETRQPLLGGFKLISKPSRHMYAKAEDMKPVRSGYGIAVISTSKGVMSSKEAKKQGVGGEILFEVW